MQEEGEGMVVVVIWLLLTGFPSRRRDGGLAV